MSDLMKRLLDTKKNENFFLSPVQRMLLKAESFEGGRRWDVIHPSELASDNFCPLAVYYRLSGWERPRDEHAFQLEVVFEQGHAYHEKWQTWAWKAGLQKDAPWGLRGRYQCLACRFVWEATSPLVCPECDAVRWRLKYLEVPVELKSHNIQGKSDGDFDLGPGFPIQKHPLLEIKSVGEGTIRYAAPQLLAKHTKTVVVVDKGEEASKRWTDWNALWRDIKRPFKAHRIQGAIYGKAMGRDEMIFVYEFKPTGAVKEFRVTHDFSLIDEILDTCLDINYAVKKQRPLDCPHGGCKLCRAFEALRDGEHDEEEDGPLDREDSYAGTGEGAAPERGSESASTPKGRGPRRPGGTRRPARRGSDGGVAGSHDVDEPPRSRTRQCRDHRGDRSDDLRADPDREAAADGAREGRDNDRAKAPGRIIIRRSGR